jgi:tRNA pseudouridine38-40 synthase
LINTKLMSALPCKALHLSGPGGPALFTDNVMKYLRMIIEYDGTGYYGWQRQSGDITIQQVLEETLQRITGEKVTLYGSSRTDAGVHALHQVAHFRTSSRIPERNLLLGLNSLIPRNIVVKDLTEVDEEFHARYSARSKTYFYRIFNSDVRPALHRNYCWYVFMPLDVGRMAEAALILKGVNDFSAFCSAQTDAKSPVREVYDARFEREDRFFLRFSVEANGFLRHMVRTIVGTLVDVGKGKINAVDFRGILESRDRKRAGVTAPPQGLFLSGVKYE